MATEQRQYLRRCKLIVSTAGGSGLDLSGLHIKFAVKKADAQTPNTAEIRVYNVAETTVARIRNMTFLMPSLTTICGAGSVAM